MPTASQENLSECLNLQVTAEQARLIRRAAHLRRSNMSSFLIDGACQLAEETLASQKHFAYSDTQWDTFLTALDAPAQEKPALRELLQQPGTPEA